MTATVIALILLAWLVFLLGRWVGMYQHESQMREAIRQDGLFQLNNGFYRAIKVSWAVDERFRQPETVWAEDKLPEWTAEPPTIQERATAAALHDAETVSKVAESTKKPVRRRVARTAH